MTRTHVAAALLVFLLILGGVRSIAQDPNPAFAPQSPAGTDFTYQGRLTMEGSPVTDACDFQFSLWDAAAGGNQVGSTQTIESVNVTAGLFTVSLNGSGQFGANAFSGDARWLGIAVRCPAGSGSYTDLDPRQALTAAPYALFAVRAPWGGLTGVPAGFADGSDADTLGGLSCSSGQVAEWTGTAWVCGTGGNGSGLFWSLIGNSGTAPGANFLGTTDAVSLTLAVGGAAALRLEPNASSPNVIGGHESNRVTADAAGATISGGGLAEAPHQISGSYATIGGGFGNTASDMGSIVAGGGSNTASAFMSVVAGGQSNTAGGEYAAVGGGAGNNASGDAASVGGGKYNAVSALLGTIAGGGSSGGAEAGNRVTDEGGAIGGGGSNLAGDDAGTETDAYYATIGGGWNNTASNQYATVGGGESNTGGALRATVSGGYSNTADGNHATIGGGGLNAASAEAATVAGGLVNKASGEFAIIPGDRNNNAAGNFSFAAGRRAKANQAGAFIWADASDWDFNSGADNEFAARATGGVRFVSSIDARNGSPTSGVELAAGANSWSVLSDRGSKANFAPVSASEVLESLSQIPIETWNYKTQEPSIRHMGPMAQDFYAAFGLGNDDKRINTIDLDGVALAAIKGLYQVVQQQEAQISTQEQQIVGLEARLEALEQAAARNDAPSQPLSSTLAGSPILFAGLLVLALALVRRWRVGGGS